jgi:hypothetical protein
VLLNTKCLDGLCIIYYCSGNSINELVLSSVSSVILMITCCIKYKIINHCLVTQLHVLVDCCGNMKSTFSGQDSNLLVNLLLNARGSCN